MYGDDVLWTGSGMVLKLREMVIVWVIIWGRRLAAELKTDGNGEYGIRLYGSDDEMSAEWMSW